MARRLLPLITSFLVCLTAMTATAADEQKPPSSSSADLRAEVDLKREHITGADALTKKGTNSAQPVLDSPVDTTDAPAVEAD
jgi:hypothetical protein